MQAQGKTRELFEAFSRINSFAYADTRLLANHVLSKAPHCDDILERYLKGEAPQSFSLLERARKVLMCWVVNLAAYFLLIGERIAQARAGLSALPRIMKMQGPLTVVDIFLLVHRINLEGKFRDHYLPGLYEVLEERGHNCVILARMYGSRNPKVLRTTYGILRDHPQPVLTELELMLFTDWLRLLWFIISLPVVTLRLSRLLTEQGAEGYIKSALIASLDQCYLSGECRRLAARRLKDALPQPEKIISWYENQVVDKCFYRGLAETGNQTPTYAAQLLTWPSTLLNNHADPSDAKHKAAPSFVAVNGPYYLPEPLEALPGAQMDEVFGKTLEETDSSEPGTEETRHYFPYQPGAAYAVGPALRYKSVYEFEVEPNPDGPVLFLLSYHPEETRCCLALARPLAEAGLKTAYKFHPASKIEDFRDLLPAEATLIRGSLEDALQGVSVVVGAGSGALNEAVAMGMPAINVEPAEGVGLNYLPPYGQGELWESAKTPEEFRAARDKLLAYARNKGEKRDANIRAFRKLVFCKPSREKTISTFDL